MKSAFTIILAVILVSLIITLIGAAEGSGQAVGWGISVFVVSICVLIFYSIYGV